MPAIPDSIFLQHFLKILSQHNRKLYFYEVQHNICNISRNLKPYLLQVQNKGNTAANLMPQDIADLGGLADRAQIDDLRLC